MIAMDHDAAMVHECNGPWLQWTMMLQWTTVGICLNSSLLVFTAVLLYVCSQTNWKLPERRNCFKETFPFPLSTLCTELGKNQAWEKLDGWMDRWICAIQHKITGDLDRGLQNTHVPNGDHEIYQMCTLKSAIAISWWYHDICIRAPKSKTA